MDIIVKKPRPLVMTLRLEPEIAKKLTDVKALMHATGFVPTGVGVSRSALIRMALLDGLRSIERSCKRHRAEGVASEARSESKTNKGRKADSLRR
jgi:hypothetical protein